MGRLPYLHRTLVDLYTVETLESLGCAVRLGEDNGDNPAHHAILSVGEMYSFDWSNSVAEIFLNLERNYLVSRKGRRQVVYGFSRIDKVDNAGASDGQILEQNPRKSELEIQLLASISKRAASVSIH